MIIHSTDEGIPSQLGRGTAPHSPFQRSSELRPASLPPLLGWGMNPIVNTIRRWIKENTIPYYKPGKEYLFIKEDLDEFLNSQKNLIPPLCL
jgi:excisionase family DNA binding protein